LSDNDAGFLVAADPVMGIIFYLIFMVVIFLIVFKMFIAILDGHFTEITSGDSNNNMGFVDLILSIIEGQVEDLKKNERETEAKEKKKEEKTRRKREVSRKEANNIELSGSENEEEVEELTEI